MSKLEDLIHELCPDGVEYKRISDVFKLYSGMTGVSNKWKDDGNCKFIDYLNVYNNLKVKTANLKNATVKNLKQNIILQGDILLTSASETPNECAISSVVEDSVDNNVFLDDHLFGLRLITDFRKAINTTFINYYFHTDGFKKELIKAIRGVTRYYISTDAFLKIKIPVPPLPVQEEIVRILDNFTELTARKQQYEHYRDTLISNISKYKIINLNAISSIYDGTHQTPKYIDEGIKFASVENIKNPYDTKKFISVDDYNLYKIRPLLGDVFMTRIGDIGICYVVDREEDLAYYVSLALIRPNKDVLNSKYLKFYLESKYGIKELRKRTLINAVPIKINKTDIGKINIILPSIEEQQRIVDILDRFDSLCNDLTKGLPAEIEARQKQYEYYRDKLLAFKCLEVDDND